MSWIQRAWIKYVSRYLCSYMYKWDKHSENVYFNRWILFVMYFKYNVLNYIDSIGFKHILHKTCLYRFIPTINYWILTISNTTIINLNFTRHIYFSEINFYCSWNFIKPSNCTRHRRSRNFIFKQMSSKIAFRFQG